MNTKKSVLSGHSNAKLKRSNKILRNLINLMFAIVLYDSFTFGLPFHYILFFVAGYVLGSIFKKSHRIAYSDEDGQILLQTNRWAILFLIVLAVVRFIVGPYILDALHFLHVSDALLLLYMGIYHRKMKVMVKQVDDMIYRFAQKSIQDKRNNDRS